MDVKLDQWTNYFFAEVGASAALCGLIFVAVSINLPKILANKQLPGRAAETLMFFVCALLLSTFALIPDQSPKNFGVEVFCLALVCWCFSTWSAIARFRGNDQLSVRWTVPGTIIAQIGTIPYVVAGVFLATGQSSGMNWIVAGTINAYIAGILNAWVLLVEIAK